MKLTLVGGGGVRAPLFVASALREANTIGLQELWLLDVSEEKLGVFGSLCRQLATMAGSSVRVRWTTDAQAALADASFVVTTIRVGGDPGRILDERIALAEGVLGQETTGAGGLAMALRTIPVMLDYCALIERVAPGAWILNFSNPAGLVTQALRDRGHQRVIGICDGANEAQAVVGGWLGVDPQRLRAEVFGLNHLSWARRVELEGEDVLGRLIADPEFLANTPENAFAAEIVQRARMWINPYLYYYYYCDDAIGAMNRDGKTRGEEILELNERLVDQLRSTDPEHHPQDALRAYHAYNQRRIATYMHYAHPGAPSMEDADRAAPGLSDFSEDEGEGYAGVALDFVKAFRTGFPLQTALNVPNDGAIDGLLESDVVEVSCLVADGRVTSMRIGAMPEQEGLLVQTVKLYERRAARAILDRSRADLVWALMVHPLVASYPRAERLVDAYLRAHEASAGSWH